MSLPDGRAFTAAHCVAAVDGRRGTMLVSARGRQWRVVRRWSPRGRDLAWLEAVNRPRIGPADLRAARFTLAPPGALRPGVDVVFHAYAGRRFVPRRAVVVSVSRTRAIAEVLSRAGVADGDSGGPVVAGGGLAGIVIARLGDPRSSHGSSRVVLTRLDLHNFCTKTTGPAF